MGTIGGRGTVENGGGLGELRERRRRPCLCHVAYTRSSFGRALFTVHDASTRAHKPAAASHSAQLPLYQV